MNIVNWNRIDSKRLSFLQIGIVFVEHFECLQNGVRLGYLNFGKLAINANNIVQNNARCIKICLSSRNEIVYLCEFNVNKFSLIKEKFNISI